MKEARLHPLIGTIAIAAIAATGCAHTVVIETEPVGAAVSIDGEFVGTSPVITEQRTSTGGRLHVAVAADSYQTADVIVTQSEWFWWPAIIAATPLLGLGVVWVPFAGPVITLVWAAVTSPTLLALAFMQRYPDRVLITLRPRFSEGIPQPTDTWLIPDDYDPNPPPLPDAKAREPEPTPPDAAPPDAPPTPY